MLVYVAGPLFSEAEREWLDTLAARLRAEGFDCFVPHENFSELNELTPGEVFRVDSAGVRNATVLLAWLDDPVADDGTACEIGIFYAFMQHDESKKGIVGLLTDLRGTLGHEGHGLNLFVHGCIEAGGTICTTLDEVVATLAAWRG